MKRKRASHFDTCVRWWARLNGKIVRFLQVSRYDEFGGERIYIRRLQNSDKRPRGVHMKGMTQSGLEVYNTLPFGVWCEIAYQ